MATLLRFTISPIELQDVIQAKDNQAELSRRSHFVAARKIQAWFRGIVTRAHLRRLHEHATVLQRHWRGYRTRLLVKRHLIAYVRQMWQDYYNRMATRIQAVWRGFWVRKTRLNFAQWRRWLREVHAKNEEVLEDMKKYRQAELERMESEAEQESFLRVLFILFKLHHLLGTECRPGVITRIDQTRFTYIEEMLKHFRYDRCISRMRLLRRDRRIGRGSSPIYRDTCLKKCEREMRELEQSLQGEDLPDFADVVDQTSEKSIETVKRTKRSSGGRSSKYSCECPHQDFAAVELCEAIDSMDCRLDHFRLRCPIHSLVL